MRVLTPLLIVLLAMGRCCLAATPPAAEESAATRSTGYPGNLRFRRVYFPEGMTAWPKGNVKYLPMEADEFERLLESIQRTAPGPPAQTSAGLVQAQYDARLKGQSVLQGSATLDVSQSVASAMLMTLDPCNLAIARAQWVTSDGAPAVLGMTGNGKLQVLAERSGQMKFDWSLAAQPSAATRSTGCPGVNFTIALPPSPVNRLRIELPAELTPSVDHGIVSDEGPTDPGFRRWRLELGGRPGCRLRLAKEGSDEARQQAILASQSTTYDFSLRGLELSVKLGVEGHREPLRKVELALDPSLELVEVSTGDVPLAWNVAADRGDKPRQVTIELPPTLQTGPLTLRLRAIAPLSTDGTWKLPRGSFAGIVCRSNTIRLTVASPLCIQRLETHGCRQTGVAASYRPRSSATEARSASEVTQNQTLLAPRASMPPTQDAPRASTGEQLDFEAFASDAEVDVSLAQRPTEVQAVSATATLLGQGKMSSRVATDFRIADGPVFSLDAEVLPNWTIDSVESQPTDGLDDWTLDRRNGRRALSIRLARPLTSARPLRLIVSARRLYAPPEYSGPAGRNLGIDDLVPLRFGGLSESKRWVDLHASGSNELHFTSGDHLRRADLKDLTAAELDLFAEPPVDLLFRDDAGTAGLRLSLENRRPKTESTPPSGPAIVPTTVGNESATAWVWDCEVRSQFAANGAANHVVSYRIQNAGSRQVRLTLPAGLVRGDVHGIWVNGKPAAALSSPGDPPRSRSVGVPPASSGPDADTGETPMLPTASQLAVDLPADLKIVKLDLRISTRGEPLGTFHRLRPPLPEIGLPIFAWHWRLELPPGYATCSYGQDPGTASATSFSLRGCLLGCLGRRADQSVFNPLRREDWQSLLCWRRTDDRPADPGAEAETVGWTQFPIDLADGTSTVMADGTRSVPGTLVVRRAAIDAASWLLFLAIVGIGAWRLSGRPFALLILAVMLALPAFLLPAAIAVIFSHGLLGVMFCLMLELARRCRTVVGPAVPSRPTEVPSTLTGITPFSVPLFAAVMLCGWNPAEAGYPQAGAQQPGAPGKSLPVTHSVFIPVNEKQQPTHGKYFLPEPFFAELYRRAALHAEKPQGWMIASAVYRATLSEDVAQEAYVVDRLTAEFEIRVFNAAARVRIPLRRDEVSLEPGQAQLDDRAVQPEWEADGSALLLEITEPGEYRLELTLRPTVRPGSRPSDLDLAIPRVAAARLELTVPTGGPQVEFPSALGAVHWEEVQSRWTAELGPANRLVAAWQDSTPAGGARSPGTRLRAPAAVDVEQLLWLKIEPGCVLLDVRMKAKAVAGQLRRLLVRADSALELLQSSRQSPFAVRPADSAAGFSPSFQILADGTRSVPATLPTVPVPIVKTRGGGESSRIYEIQWPAPASGSPAADAGSPGASSPLAATFDLHFLCIGAASVGTCRVPQIDVVDARPVRRSLAVSIDPVLEYQVSGARLQETAAVPEFIANWGESHSPPDLAFRLNGNAAEWNLITRPRRTETSGDQNAIWSFDAQTAELQLAAQLTTAAGNLFQYRLDAPPALHVDSVAVLAEGYNRVARWSQDQDGRVAVFFASPVSGHHELQLHGRMPLPKQGRFALPQVRLEEVRIQNSLIGLYRRPDVLVEVSGVAGSEDVKTIEEDTSRTDRGQPVRSFYADAAATSPALVTIKPNRPHVQAEQVTRITCADNQWHTTCEYGLQVSAGLLDAIELEVPASWKENVKISPAMAATFTASSEESASLVLSPSAAISGNFAWTLTGPPLAAARFAVPNVTLKHVQGIKRYVILPKSAYHRPVAWALRNLRRCDSKAATPDDEVKYEVVGEPCQAVLLPPQKTTVATRVVQADVRYAWQADGRCLGAAFLDVETASAIDCPLELPAGFDLLQLTINGLPVDAARRPRPSAPATRRGAPTVAPAGTWTVPLASQASVSRVEMLFFAESALPQVPIGWTRRCSFRAPKLGDLPVERTVWTIASPRTWQPANADGQDPAPPTSAGPAKTGDIAAQWQRFIDSGLAIVSSPDGGTAEAITVDYRPIEARSWFPRLAGIATFLAAAGLAAWLIRRGLLWSWFVRWPYLFGVGFGLAWWLWLSPSAAGLLIVLAVLLRQFLPWRRRILQAPS